MSEEAINQEYFVNLVQEYIYGTADVCYTDYELFWLNMRNQEFCDSVLLSVLALRSAEIPKKFLISLLICLDPDRLSQSSQIYVNEMFENSSQDVKSLWRALKKDQHSPESLISNAGLKKPLFHIPLLMMPHFSGDAVYQKIMDDDLVISHPFFQVLVPYLFSNSPPSASVAKLFFDINSHVYQSCPSHLALDVLAKIRLETIIPCGAAALKLYDSMNNSYTRHFFVSEDPALEHFIHDQNTHFDQEDRIVSLLSESLNRALHQNENGTHLLVKADNIAGLFSRFVSLCYEALLNPEVDIAPMFKELLDNSIDTEAHITPFMQMHTTFEYVSLLDNKEEANHMKVGGNLYLRYTHLRRLFTQLTEQDLPAAIKDRPKPDMYVAICGGASALSYVLSGYASFALECPTEEYTKNLSFILLSNDTYPLVSFINSHDMWFKYMAQAFYSLLDGSIPKINDQYATEYFTLLDKTEIKQSTWGYCTVPTQLPSRLLSFYSQYANCVTEVPIWSCNAVSETGYALVIPLIDCMFIGPKFAKSLTQDVSGTMLCVVSYPDGKGIGKKKTYEYSGGFSLSISNYAKKGSNCVFDITDSSLFVNTVKPPQTPDSKEAMKKMQFLCNTLSFHSSTPFAVIIDSLRYEGLVAITLTRMKNKVTGKLLSFPIKHFQPLDPW